MPEISHKPTWAYLDTCSNTIVVPDRDIKKNSDDVSTVWDLENKLGYLLDLEKVCYAAWFGTTFFFSAKESRTV
jgi:hypothetical protein